MSEVSDPHRSLFLRVMRNSLYPTNRQLRSRSKRTQGMSTRISRVKLDTGRPSGKFDEGTADPSCDISSQIKIDDVILMFTQFHL